MLQMVDIMVETMVVEALIDMVEVSSSKLLIQF